MDADEAGSFCRKPPENTGGKDEMVIIICLVLGLGVSAVNALGIINLPEFCIWICWAAALLIAAAHFFLNQINWELLDLTDEQSEAIETGKKVMAANLDKISAMKDKITELTAERDALRKELHKACPAVETMETDTFIRRMP